jgi:hypothetical protein
MNKRIRYIPDGVTDILMHGKDSDRTERVLMPITRYDNILSSPTVVTEEIETHGAPFHLLEVETVEMTEEEIRKLCGHII